MMIKTTHSAVVKQLSACDLFIKIYHNLRKYYISTLSILNRVLIKVYLISLENFVS